MFKIADGIRFLKEYPNLTRANDTSLQVNSTHGYIRLGPGNTSYAHILTDRGQFYFNKQLTVETGIIQSYDEDLTLSRISSSTARIVISSSRTASNQPLTILGGSSAWNTSTQGNSKGSLHLDPEDNTDEYGSAITFGASDTGNGDNAHAGIYVRSDGNYGTKMYLSTTDSYASGSKTAISIDHLGHVTVPRGSVGIGENAPLGKLHVKDGDAGSITANSAHDTVIIEGSGNTGINIFSPNTSYQYLAFGDPEGANSGYVRYQHSTNQMVLRAGGADTVYVNSDGHVGIGQGSPSVKLEVYDSTTWDTAHFSSNTGTGAGISLDATSTGVRWSVIAQGTSGGAADNNLGFHLTAAGTSGQSTGYKAVLTSSGGVKFGSGSFASIGNSKMQIAGGRVDITTSDTDNGAYRFYQDTTFRGGFGTTNWTGAANSGNNGVAAYATGGDFTIHHNSGTPSARFSDEGHFGLEKSDAASNITNGYPKIVYPNVHWSSSSNPGTGAVKIRTPGNLSNYDMCHIVLTVYEYTGDAGSTIIIGGHNWTSGANSSNAGWHNYNVQVIGSFNKPIYLTQDANDRYIVLGDNNSSWTYGMVSVQRVHGASFYPAGIDWVGDWHIEQTTTATYTWTTANLNSVSSTTLRTPGTFHFAHNGGNGMQIGRSNDSNMFISTATGGDAGLSLRNSSGTFRSQWYGDGTNYGFLDGDWANWDIKKVINGEMYFNSDSTYFLRPEGTSYFNKLGIGTSTVSGATKLRVEGTDNSLNLTIATNSTGGPILYLHSTAASGKLLGIISNNTSNAGGAGFLQFWNATDSHTFATWGTTSGSLSRIYTDLAVAGDTTNSTFNSPGQVALKRSNGNPYLSFHDNAGSRSGYIQSVHSDDLLGFYDYGTYRFQSLAANTTVQIQPTDAGLALLQVGKSTSGTQGTGAVEVTQDGLHGGGISYNGDGTPAFVNGETADHIAFYRNDNGSRTEVFKYPYNSNTVTFNGVIELGGDSEHQIQRRTTSAVTSATTDVTEVKGRQIDLYAYDDIHLRAGTGDKITFTAGGAERVRIESSGNVGIGTTSPTASLEIDGGSTSTLLKVDGSTGTMLQVDNNTTGTVFTVSDTSGVPSIDVNDDGTVRVAEFDGNMLVGDVTDDTVNKVQVDGTIKATAAATLIIYNSAGTAVKTINGINS